MACGALADFLDENPDLPVSSVDAHPYISASDEEERAEVDRIAAILGAPATANRSGTHYETTRGFGGGVVYQATAITAAHMAEYEERQRQLREMDEG